MMAGRKLEYNERQVTYLGSDQKRRSSAFAARSIGGSRLSMGREAGGVLRADASGVTLTRFVSKRFSALRSKRASAKTELLCTVEELQDARLSPDAQETREGKWQLVVQKQGDGAPCVVHSFRSSSMFEAVGWLQQLRVLRGLREMPVVVALGETGAGKSLLCSTLTGLPATNPVFKVAASLQSVTAATDMYMGRWFGEASADEVIVVDTPGLHDSEDRDAEHVADMLMKLAQLGYVHAFVLVLNAESPRLSNALRAMLRVYEHNFGAQFWTHAMILFSHWYTDPKASARRKARDEASTAAAWNEELARRFPSVAKLPRAALGLQCFFADTDAPDGPERQQMRAQLAKLAAAAEGGFGMDCRAVLPDARAALGGRDVPEQARALAAFLRQQGLVEKLPRLVENGVYTMEAAAGLPNRVLRNVLGWTREDIKRLRGSGEPVSVSAPNHVLVRDFAALGLPTEGIEAAQITVAELLAMDDAAICAQFGVKVGQLATLAGWRETVMRHQPCGDAILWEGAIVTRNAPGWQSGEERRPQDFHGPGMILNWRALDGQTHGVLEAPDGWQGHPRAFAPPSYPGWARVYWFNSGYTNVHRIGADDVKELKFDVAADFGIVRADPDDPAEAEFDAAAAPPAGRVSHQDLRCTFAFPKGQKFAHWALFDARPAVCRAVGGFEPGQVVKIRGSPSPGLEAMCVGVGCEEDGGIKLWFKVTSSDDVVGAGLFPDHMLGQLELVRTVPVPSTAYDDWDCHSDDGIENDEMDFVAKNLDMNFPYVTGVRFREYASFDRSDGMLDRFGFGLRHGDVIVHKSSNTKFVVIGISTHDSETPRFWMHADRNPGASVWTCLHNDLGQFERTGRKETVNAVNPPVNNFTAPTEAEARAMQLQPSFEFPRGAGAFTTPQQFDVREETCVRMCSLPHGAVLTGPDGKRLTVVGVAPDPDSGVPQIWFHLEGHRGAGLIPNFARLLIGGVFTDTGERADVSQLRQQIAEAPEPANPLQALMQALQAASEGATGQQEGGGGGAGANPRGGGNAPSSPEEPPGDGDGDDGEGDDDFVAFLRNARPPP